MCSSDLPNFPMAVSKTLLVVLVAFCFAIAVVISEPVNLGQAVKSISQAQENGESKTFLTRGDDSVSLCTYSGSNCKNDQTCVTLSHCDGGCHNLDSFYYICSVDGKSATVGVYDDYQCSVQSTTTGAEGQITVNCDTCMDNGDGDTVKVKCNSSASILLNMFAVGLLMFSFLL